ncbi:MAG TPA: M23 family metallopeptidase [Candidatus Limnocylindria bacterium]|nr:M23 family metallopeptidase [Candidatus Limnocylindria bacterium]
MSGIYRRPAVMAILVASLLAVPPRAAATDDFTLPFVNPAVPLNYGVDRDPRVGYQLDWTGQLWHDNAAHFGRVYDQHTGIDYGLASLSLVASARNGTVVDIEEGFGTNDHGAAGNFVRVRHPDGRDTLYYHLAQNGALVSVGQAVLAGQTIARSGCSGNCSGPHLHFELLQLSGGVWRSVDPQGGHLWTTWPGRVPYLAAYTAESNSSTVAIKRLATSSHWVEFRNTGGRSWSRDASGSRLLLGTWNPAARSSVFRAADWPSYWIATYLDQATVAPDGIGRFTFGLRAPSTTGSYSEAFNLRVDPVSWFDHARLGGYYVPLYVYSGQQP